MDVGNPSNFERMLEIFGSDYRVMRAVVGGEVVADPDILDAMARYYRDYQLFIDPHTAAGIVAAERYLEGEGASDAVVVTLATAHPAKFVESVTRATGYAPDLPARLAEVMTLPKHSIPVEPTSGALREYLLGAYGS